MNTGIITAIVSGVVAIIVAFVNTNARYNDLLAEIKTHNAVQDEKISTLTNEVMKHNNIVERTYKLEKEVAVLNTKV